MCLQLRATWHFCLLPSKNSATTFTFLLLLLCCCANSMRISNPWSRSLLIKPIWRRRNEATYTFSFITRFVYTPPSKNTCDFKKIILFFPTMICLKGIFKSDIHWTIKYLMNLNFKSQYDCAGRQNWTNAYHCHYELLTGEIELSHFRLNSWDHGHKWTSFLCTV